MASRLGHKKSRKGCKRCKARRVKCDETHPSCSNCTKHGATCEYAQGAPARSENPQSSVEINNPFSAATSPVHLPSPYANNEEIEGFFEELEARRALELRLLHHFLTIVSYTFPACDQQLYRDIWTIDAVLSGFQHPFLFNAILAISALHLLSDPRSMTYFYARDENQLAVERVTKSLFITDTDKSKDLAKVHRRYLNTAVREQRDAISNLSASNADAVFMAALLISYQSLKLIPEQSTLSAYTPPVQWLRMAKAVSTITRATLPMAQSDSMMARLLSYLTEPDLRDEMAMFNPAYRKPFEALLDWDRYPEPFLDSDIKNTYERALAYVGGTYSALLNKDAPRIMIRRVLCLGVLVPTRFIELVEHRRPRALVILAHHLAMAQAVEEHWWLHGVADIVVKGIESILPSEWQWAMAWPLSFIQTPNTPS